MREFVRAICTINDWQYIDSHAISGGDINASFSVVTDKGKFFVKINSANDYPEMFVKEAEGLEALRQSLVFKIPEVIVEGKHEGKQYLVMELLEKFSSPPGFWKQSAEVLAGLHQISSDYFGWKSFNYIGSLQQQNDYKSSWAEFYASQRIMPLVKVLSDKGLLERSDVQQAEKLCSRLHEIFPPEAPSLLHGDLWGGNFMPVKDEKGTVPSIYDPPVYYGHREMDLGMTLLFGGFDNSFYGLYNEFFPLEKQWRERVSLTQLYPLLVHAILFGGGYISKCKNIIQEWR